MADKPKKQKICQKGGMDQQLTSPVISPLCLYYISTQADGVVNGAIFTPNMVTRDGKSTFKCLEPARRYGGWYLGGRFYAVNPMYRFIPFGMKLMCAKQAEPWPYTQTELKPAYDPFNLDDDCVYFITWTQPVPYTTPLYNYQNGNNSIPSFEEHPPNTGWKLNSTMYVLTDKPRSSTILPEKGKWFNMKEDGTPDFKFKSYFGRCIPNPDGESLEKCTAKQDTIDVRPFTLLDYLNQVEKRKTKARNVVPRFFKKTQPIYVSLVLIVFLVALAVLVFFLFRKNKNDIGNGRRYGK